MSLYERVSTKITDLKRVLFLRISITTSHENDGAVKIKFESFMVIIISKFLFYAFLKLKFYQNICDTR